MNKFKRLLARYAGNACLVLSFLAFSCSLAAQDNYGNWNSKNSEKWLKSRDWAGGMTLKADRSVNAEEFAKEYHANKKYWDLAFAWLKDNNPETVAPGKYVLDSTNVIVNVTDANSTRDFEKTTWECHCKYIDLQYIARGKEKMGKAPLKDATIVAPYKAKGDGGVYNVPEGKAKYTVAKPGSFLLFFPSEVHRPNIKVKGYDKVKKIVIKIKAVPSEDPFERQEKEAKMVK